MSKPDKECFDREWRKSCSVAPCSVSEVSGFLEAHYLHKRPAVVRLCLIMTHGIWAAGCAVYAMPPRETSVRYGGETWELARLYVSDEVPQNAETWLIGQSVKYIRQHFPSVRFLVSYADPSAGHSGTIYRAAGWRQDGKTDEGRRTPRFDYRDESTGKVYSRKSHVPGGATIGRVPRVSKHRFVLPLHD